MPRRGIAQILPSGEPGVLELEEERRGGPGVPPQLEPLIVDDREDLTVDSAVREFHIRGEMICDVRVHDAAMIERIPSLCSRCQRCTALFEWPRGATAPHEH